METLSIASGTAAKLGGYDFSRLDGKLIKVWPYSRGYYQRDILYHAWQVMDKEDLLQFIFHGQAEPVGKPIKQRGDLIEFIKYFTDNSRALLIIQRKDTDKIGGLMWLDDIIQGFRACGNLCFAKDCRKEFVQEATQICFDYSFKVFGLKSLFGFTPWGPATEYALRSGMTQVARVPEFQMINDVPTDIAIVRITREEFYAKTNSGRGK